ncbi:MAG: cupin domain-containing protein [Deltaproteobacteria bacterium]|nr:cupin domain-containing protein [Deltaproteobacteria bacterium]
MKASISKYEPSREFFTPEGCYILELSNTPADPQASIARARVLPGATTRWHLVKGTRERYVILEGRGWVEVGDLPPQEVGPGDVVVIPPDCRQRIANMGGQDLVFLCLCTPRFMPEAYEDLENCPPEQSPD